MWRTIYRHNHTKPPEFILCQTYLRFWNLQNRVPINNAQLSRHFNPSLLFSPVDILQSKFSGKHIKLLQLSIQWEYGVIRENTEWYRRILSDTGGSVVIPEDTGGNRRIPKDTEWYRRILSDTGGYGRIRSDTGGSWVIREDTGGYGEIPEDPEWYGRIREDTEWYRRIRSDTGGYWVIREDTEWYGRILSDTGGYGVIPEDPAKPTSSLTHFFRSWDPTSGINTAAASFRI